VSAVRRKIALVALAIVAVFVVATAGAVALWNSDGDEPQSTKTQTA
jgi:sensor domain CHASE-containing protein